MHAPIGCPCSTLSSDACYIAAGTGNARNRQNVATRLLLLRYTLAMRWLGTPGNSGRMNSICLPPSHYNAAPLKGAGHTCLNTLYTLLTFGYLVVQVRTLQLTYPHPSLVPRRSLDAAQDAWIGNTAQHTHDQSSASSCHLRSLHLRWRLSRSAHAAHTFGADGHAEPVLTKLFMHTLGQDLALCSASVPMTLTGGSRLASNALFLRGRFPSIDRTPKPLNRPAGDLHAPR